MRVINLAGDDTSTMTITITAPSPTPTPTPAGTPTGSPTPTPTPTPTPEVCAYPPNVIGMSPSAAESALSGWTHVIYGDLTKGTKNKIQAQNPDYNNCSMKSLVTVIAHYRPG